MDGIPDARARPVQPSTVRRMRTLVDILEFLFLGLPRSRALSNGSQPQLPYVWCYGCSSRTTVKALGFKVRLFNGSSSGPCCEVGLTSLIPVWLSDWLTNSYWEYLSFKRAIHAGTDLKGTECLGVRYVNKSGYYFMFVNMCWNCYVQFLFLQRTSMHMDCIYIVPSISSFHIVYFCGMYVPVKMQICVFIFNLQYM